MSLYPKYFLQYVFEYSVNSVAAANLVSYFDWINQVIGDVEGLKHFVYYRLKSLLRKAIYKMSLKITLKSPTTLNYLCNHPDKLYTRYSH